MESELQRFISLQDHPSGRNMLGSWIWGPSEHHRIYPSIHETLPVAGGNVGKIKPTTHTYSLHLKIQTYWSDILHITKQMVGKAGHLEKHNVLLDPENNNTRGNYKRLEKIGTSQDKQVAGNSRVHIQYSMEKVIYIITKKEVVGKKMGSL